jgi:hypothetical protein
MIMNRKIKIFIIGLIFVYCILVFDNIIWNLVEGNLAERYIWIFVTEFTNWQDIITMIIFAPMFLIPFKMRLKEKFLYLFGVMTTYAILGINNVLWNKEGLIWYQNLLSIFEWRQDWVTMIIGGVIFLIIYYRTKPLL